MTDSHAPIFVVGHPRSGTTLLASMLGRHPDLVSTPESLFMNQVRYQLIDARKQGPEALVEAAMTGPLQYMISDRAGFVAELKAASAGAPLDENTVFATLLEHYRRAHGATRVVEKTPLHLRHLDELVDWFPDCRIIWIIRDGRACVRSLQKVDWATGDAATLARQWVRNISFGNTFAAQAGARLTTVRYEALLADPATELARLCAHIGVEPVAEMLDTGGGTTVIKPQEMSWKGKVNTPVDASRADAWRRELTPEDLAKVSPIMNDTLRALGYPTDPVASTLETWRGRLYTLKPAVRLQRMIFDRRARMFGPQIGRNAAKKGKTA
ncbi:sulfotransferase family protein [Salipiger mangrovisoli]|uniref:Sulfotransferase n=1 Tax=Salipiger mangrovisoli TaxID=2865933 RepID=A0ABR9X0W3_9RHOB|nr:sulfotransferase [Salipiger mangrovisoli]MBE9637076.1 sulfotransferase [Salipiger mangrovisoli]